ncbi:hypothetical protein G9C98_008082 [Cotesia typhae]|uniref:Uncharacterized protein n=1 Tax=Cotesia typhae TaxID=2053667 RepID=A0A8J5VBH4_9HYME|nr:hypothetical protein G9C98_008082 [Cotesia typhae]
MDQSRNNPQDKVVKGTSISERYPTLRAFLEADARKIKSLRQYFQSFVPAHHSVNSQECVPSTTSSDRKRKQEDDDNKPRKK